jgi:hypothetical protein
MGLLTRIGALVIISAFSWDTVYAQLPATGTQEAPSLGDVARQNRQNKPQHDTTRPEIKQLIADMTAAGEGSADEDQYRHEIQDLLVQQKFETLDKAAHEVRISRARLAGGGWRLYVFYDAAAKPSSGKAATDAEWDMHIATLTRWVTERPQSITARVALAEAYLGWGWMARGHGYANTVSNQGWGLMGERVARAKKILIDAGSLPEKCPFWFESMQHLALAEGWDKTRARALLDQAVSFEPTYYHFYREYANFVLPKWYGEDGEAEAFANEVASSAPGLEGAFLYFEIATTIHCSCGERKHGLRMSWDRIKQGYAAMEQLYGTSTLKMNRFAYVAYLAQDHKAAHDVFVQIGTNWDEKTWGTRQEFDHARAWADADATPQVRVQSSR